MPRFTVARDGARMEIVFDDGAMNLLSSAALEELSEIIGEIRDAPALLVFRSGRPGLFAAGADMAEMRRFTAPDAGDFSAAGQSLFERIETLPAATVAVIDGDCFGGALDLALAFDRRLATPRARFSHPGARLGIVTGFGGTTRWRKVLSRPAATALFLGNRILSADEALSASVVDAVGEDFEDDLQTLAKADRRTVQLVKELTNCAPSLTRSQLLLLGRRLGTPYFDT